MATDKPGFLEELKRRHVWRVAIAYLIAAWLVVQIATQVFPFFNIPNWAVRLVVLLLALGFVVVVALAWVYEITPEGIRRTAPADSPEARQEGARRDVGRKLNTVIIAVLVLAVLLLFGNQFLWHKGMAPAGRVVAAASSPGGSGSPDGARSPDEAERNPGASSSVAPDSAAAAAASGLLPASGVPEKSVAVLPFENDSGDKGQQYFSDGLSQDLITALTQFAGLKVISRDSAFQFRDSRDSAAAIAAKLGVAHLLEGSVQHQGDEVRISVTLVNAADGSTLWSQHYDKPYKDLFALQDAITKNVADALQAKLLTTPGAVIQSDRPPGGNLAAYAAYQRGVADFAQASEASIRKSNDAFNDAIRLDPRYAAAYAQLSTNWTGLAIQYLSGAAQQQTFAQAREAAATALALDPNLALAHVARGYVQLYADFDWRGAQAEYQRALQLAPQDDAAMFNLGNLDATLGQVQQAVVLSRKALAADPLHANWYMWLGNYLAGLGHTDEAEQAMRQGIALQPAADAFHEELTIVEILRGKPEAALAAAQQESAPGWRRIALALATQIGPDRKAADAALATLIAKDADFSPYQIAEVYALRHDPDDTFKWLEHARSARDPGIQYLLSDPFILRYLNDPRFAAFCRKVGLPTATDAVAMK